MTTRADELVARFILRAYRDDKPEHHLALCPDATVEHPEAEDGVYGCDTGCSYVRMTATITCSHGESDDYWYGDFGELASIIEDMGHDTDA